ncbi:hypothetical protein BDY19DRAFT_994586 [Irpex rosettiformis]|uniref:Uncharacterized protein n=1 Tax=Irpex rosettiformis TaxID=378272 RepID=A0ACB8U0B6_9APHY|nr:hypothetical protein BDY19DRAFT_994586 [Irpex rosettiformis]
MSHTSPSLALSRLNPTLPITETAELLYMSSVETLVKFRKISPLARRLVQSELKTRLHNKLENLFDHWQDVLTAMRTCNFVFSGKFVLSFLDPFANETFDHVEILAGDDRTKLVHFVNILKSRAYAEHLDYITDVPDFRQGAYSGALWLSCPKTTVRIVISVHTSPLFLIPQYVSTHLMNYLTPKYLHVAYPTLTFAKKGVLLVDDLPPSLFGTYQLGARGDILPGVDCDASSSCGARYRWFNDPISLAVGFGERFTVEKVLHWKIGGDPCNVNCHPGLHLVGEDPH